MDIYATREELKLRQKSIFDLELKVAYYARVSTDKEEQKTSIEHQWTFFEQLISGVKNWKFIDGYIDEGISGITVTHREEFQRMLQDAKDGKIDLIITKEITRFARNVLDSIRYTRELLDCGTAVWFQNDNINTLDEDSELRLSIMSGIAQEESRKLSSRVRFGHARSIQNGVVLGNSHIYGWDKRNGKLFLNPEEAKMVQLIFEKYALGNWSTHSLEQFLWECGYRNYKGGRINSHVIANIIRNPKYKGYYVGGKVKIVDLFTKKQKFLPENEWIMYKDDGTHVPAIVDEKLWENANRILKERSKNIKSKKTSYKQNNLFTGLIHCTEDGAAYWVKVRTVREKDAKTCVCSHRIKHGAISCKSKPIKEELLLKMISDVYNDMAQSNKNILHKYLELYEKELNKSEGTEEKIHSLQHEITALEQKRDKLLDYNMGGYISDAEFLSRNQAFTQQIAKKKEDLEQLKNTKPLSKAELLDQMDKILDYAKEYSYVKTKDITRSMIENTIHKIEITPINEKKAEVLIVFKSGSLHSSDAVIPALGQEKAYITETGYEYVMHSGIIM